MEEVRELAEAEGEAGRVRVYVCEVEGVVAERVRATSPPATYLIPMTTR
jgi:hypothetical protein